MTGDAQPTAAPGQPTTPTPSAWQRWKKRLLIAGLSLLTVILVVLLLIDVIATSISRSLLADVFKAEHSLDGVALGLSDSSVQIDNFQIEQPAGFAGAPMLQLDSLAARADLWTLSSDRIHIHEVAVTGLQLRLVRHADGQLSVDGLLQPALFQAGEEDDDTEAVAGASPLIVIDKLTIGPVSLTIEDSCSGQSWTSTLGSCNLHIDGLEIDLRDEFDLRWHALKIDLQHLEIDQLPTFGHGHVLASTDIAVELLGMEGLLTNHVISQARIDGCKIHVHSMKEGGNSLDAAINHIADIFTAVGSSFQQAAQPNPSQDHIVGQNTATSSSPDDKPSEPTSPSLLLTDLQLRNSQVCISDHVMTDEVLDLTMADMQLSLTGLQIIPPADPPLAEPFNKPARLQFSAVFRQPPGYPDSPVSLLASIGPLDPAAMLFATRLQWTGLAFDSFGQLVSQSTRRAMGAQAVDVTTVASLSFSQLSLQGVVHSDKGIRYPFTVQGPLGALNVNTADILGGVANRLGGGLRNIGFGTVKMGGQIVGGGVNAAKSISGGAVDVSKNIVGGVWDVAKGIATLDGKSLGDGVKQATVGTVKESANALGHAGGDLGRGATLGVQTLAGNEQQRRWLQEVTRRHQQGVHRNLTALFGSDAARDAQPLSSQDIPPSASMPNQ